jgi:hypothetical protein
MAIVVSGLLGLVLATVVLLFWTFVLRFAMLVGPIALVKDSWFVVCMLVGKVADLVSSAASLCGDFVWALLRLGAAQLVLLILLWLVGGEDWWLRDLVAGAWVGLYLFQLAVPVWFALTVVRSLWALRRVWEPLTRTFTDVMGTVTVFNTDGPALRHRLRTYWCVPRILYHQTSPAAAAAILASGVMRVGTQGSMGGGIYFALTPEATDFKAHQRGVTLEVAVTTGRVKFVDHCDPGLTGADLLTQGYDSVYTTALDTGPEIVVYSPDQAAPLRIVGQGVLEAWAQFPRPHMLAFLAGYLLWVAIVKGMSHGEGTTVSS